MSLQREEGGVAWGDTKATVRCGPKENPKQMRAHSVQAQEPVSTALILVIRSVSTVWESRADFGRLILIIKECLRNDFVLLGT